MVIPFPGRIEMIECQRNKIIGGFIAILIGSTLGGLVAVAPWFFYVNFDEGRVATLVAEFKAKRPPMPPDDQNRIVGILKVAKKFKEREKTWSEKGEGFWDEWQYTHFFDREEIDSPTVEGLRNFFLQNDDLIREVLEALGRPAGTIPFPESVERIGERSLEALAQTGLGSFILVYCDLLATEGRWAEATAILGRLLVWSGDLTMPSTDPLYYMSGHLIREKAAKWLAQAVQAPAVREAKPEWVQLETDLIEIEEKHATAADLLLAQISETHEIVQKWRVKELKQEQLQKSFDLLFSAHYELFGEKLGWRERAKKYFYETLLQTAPKRFLAQSAKRRQQQLLSLYDLAVRGLDLPQVKDLLGWELETITKMLPTDLMWLRASLVLVRLAQYHETHGGYPETLVELGSIPHDPFRSGMPFGYRRERQGFVLYSAGAEGQGEIISRPIEMPEIVR